MADRILLIEEDPKESHNIQKLLEDNGYPVIALPSGEDALVAVSTISDFNLILCSSNLTGMPGWQVCANFKKNPKLCLTPFYIISNNNAISELAKNIKSGADDVISKDTSKEIFLWKVFAGIRNSKMFKDHLKYVQFKTVHAMLGSMSHEFNNAINIAVGHLELIKESVANRDEIKDELLPYIESMNKSISRIAKLINRMYEIIEKDVEVYEYTKGTNIIKF